LNNPEATNECIDAEGYFHTGDVAIQNKEGHFFIVDRIKELIKFKGFQVPPAELEAILVSKL
jgi:long-subunit acyl-CoA synthetase (AMP-forming)